MEVVIRAIQLCSLQSQDNRVNHTVHILLFSHLCKGQFSFKAEILASRTNGILSVNYSLIGSCLCTFGVNKFPNIKKLNLWWKNRTKSAGSKCEIKWSCDCCSITWSFTARKHSSVTDVSSHSAWNDSCVVIRRRFVVRRIRARRVLPSSRHVTPWRCTANGKRMKKKDRP